MGYKKKQIIIQFISEILFILFLAIVFNVLLHISIFGNTSTWISTGEDPTDTTLKPYLTSICIIMVCCIIPIFVIISKLRKYQPHDLINRK